MSNKLSDEQLENIRKLSGYGVTSDQAEKLFNHITALEEELKGVQRDRAEDYRIMSRAVAEAECNRDGAVALVGKLREELKAAQEEIASHRCLPKKVRDDAINDFRSALVEAVREYAHDEKRDRWDILELIQTFELEK